MSSARRYARAAVVAAIAGAPLLVATPANAAAPSVTPTLECQFHNADGTYSAVFGYTNTGSSPKTIQPGPQNHFTPAQPSVTQPTVFQPGTHIAEVVIVWNGSGSLTWRLDTHSVQATASSPKCTTASQLPVVASGTVAAIGLGAFTILGVVFYRRRRAHILTD